MCKFQLSCENPDLIIFHREKSSIEIVCTQYYIIINKRLYLKMKRRSNYFKSIKLKKTVKQFEKALKKF